MLTQEICKDCGNLPTGETCPCIACGNVYYHGNDEGCYCDEPCEAFIQMLERARKEAKT